MSKARVRSMQRGARLRHRTFVPAHELYKTSPPRLARREKANFEFGEKRQEQFVESFRDFIELCKKNGSTRSKSISEQLNKNGFKTACGNTWTRRLTWFLLSFLYSQESANRPKKIQYTANPDLVLIKKVQKNTGLTDAEVKNRIEAVRKNK